LLLLMAVAGLTVTGAYGASLFMNWSERDAAARFALNRGVEHFERGDYDRAIDSLNRGVSRTDDGPRHSDVSHEPRKRLKQAGRARSAADVHAFIDQARFLDGDRHLPEATQRVAEVGCREAWDAREKFLDMVLEGRVRLPIAEVRRRRFDVHRMHGVGPVFGGMLSQPLAGLVGGRQGRPRDRRRREGVATRPETDGRAGTRRATEGRLGFDLRGPLPGCRPLVPRAGLLSIASSNCNSHDRSFERNPLAERADDSPEADCATPIIFTTPRRSYP